MQQVIYSRYEYPTTEKSSAIFEEYGSRSIQDENGTTVGGLTAAVRCSNPRAVIIFTYDEQSDVYMRLKLYGRKDVTITKIK